MPLDIDTPAGRETLAHERRAADIFRQHTGLDYAGSPKASPALLDGVAVGRGELCYGLETKARRVTHDDLMRTYHARWLLSYNKLTAAQRFSSVMHVPVLGLLYLVPDDVLLIVRLTHPDASLAVRFWFERTETKASVNGGLALRENAYIDVARARPITMLSPARILEPVD
jgi:hypothetical protein